jgi:hypothetical protein
MLVFDRLGGVFAYRHFSDLTISALRHILLLESDVNNDFESAHTLHTIWQPATEILIVTILIEGFGNCDRHRLWPRPFVGLLSMPPRNDYHRLVQLLALSVIEISNLASFIVQGPFSRSVHEEHVRAIISSLDRRA